VSLPTVYVHIILPGERLGTTRTRMPLKEVLNRLMPPEIGLVGRVPGTHAANENRLAGHGHTPPDGAFRRIPHNWMLPRGKQIIGNGN
jgi:hypothetical protein